MDIKVEIGLDLGETSPTAFLLDDPVRGVLDSEQYTLGGSLFFDITERVRDISTGRGKNDELNKIDTGTASITFDNSDRFFDPLYPQSQFFGFLVPRREVKISANGYPVYYGYIDDLDFTYSPGGVSTAKIDLVDAFSTLNNAKLPELNPEIELPGERINYILNQPEVGWAANQREIEDGTVELLDNAISENTNVLSYLQLVTQSEFGELFVTKNGKIAFKSRTSSQSLKDLAFTDNPVGGGSPQIPYTSVNTIYGSENLYNRIVISNADIVPEEVIVEDTNASQFYGVRSYELSGLLTLQTDDLEMLANELLLNYKEPRYRFESITVSINKLDESQTNAILDLEIGDLVEVSFTPNGIPPAINFPTRIIGINHDWQPTNQRVTFKFETLATKVLILDNPAFGLLDTGVLS